MQHILAPDFSFFEQPNCKSSEQRVALKLNCSGLSFEKLDRQTDIVFHLSFYNFLFLPTNVWCLFKFVPNESSIADVAKSGLIPRSCTHQNLSRAVYSISMILSQGKPFKTLMLSSKVIVTYHHHHHHCIGFHKWPPHCREPESSHSQCGSCTRECLWWENSLSKKS